jgi:P pilus assembly chaperone PapD
LTAEGNYASFAWSNGQSGQNITITNSGTYTVTVTDANGCTGTDSEVVSPGAAANTSITGPTSVCPNASATLTATGSFQSYQWSSGETTNSINVNSAGTYTVTVTNSDGCTGTATQVLGDALLPSVSFSVASPEVCIGDCLAFNVSFNGIPPFSMTYTTGAGAPQTQSFSANSGTLEVCPPAGTPPGAVTLAAVSLTDANCVCEQ